MAIRRWIEALLAGVAIAAGVLAWRAMHPPAPGPLPVVPCRVTIADPASGLADVRLDFDRDALRNRRHLILAFGDVRGSSRMVRAFSARLDGRDVAVRSEDVRGALVYFVPIAGGARDLSITYTIEPTYSPPAATRQSRQTPGAGSPPISPSSAHRACSPGSTRPAHGSASNSSCRAGGSR
jgi:hypothetical protein